ncbi:G-protein coupled receptor Mth2-like isoform X5 [Athalia rosae]|uniref:G-protein coupled receptor Mth2-like isoform X5 n=1 Tax=Athalia rosae TaxID=37344 RepID=UPI002033C7E3|nr:G-protein coupled receptor Mth2-like isoform X5 [Athalia rosae]
MAGLRVPLLLLAIGVGAVAPKSPEDRPPSIPRPMGTRVNVTGEIRVPYGSVEFAPEVRGAGTGAGAACSHGGGKPCLPLCCPFGMKLVTNGSYCAAVRDGFDSVPLPPLHSDDLSAVLSVEANPEDFQTFVSDPCEAGTGYVLEPDEDPADFFYLLSNGSLRLPNGETSTMSSPEEYCLWRGDNSTAYLPRLCMPDENAEESEKLWELSSTVGMSVSIPFLIATFLVYTVLPEMRNIHGLTLSAYVGCLVVAFASQTLANNWDIVTAWMPACIFISFTIHFSFLASFFWLNVMCFDIWWTFGGFRALRGSIKQRERKKFFMYSIYAWGCAILLTAVCVIMDFVPGIPDTVIRPEFGEERCWFRTETAKALYFYGPMGLTVLCNIFLFVSTAIKIIRHKKDTAHHLKGTDSRRHDDNKQWFNLYLKLFIVMGINWSMEIISWLCQGPKSLWYITDMGNTLQGVIIFIIFVWKEKIKRLLIKRFGCQGPNFLPRDSTRSAYHSSASRTCTTSIPLHEETNGTPDPLSPSRAKPSLDDSDGV